MASELGVQTIQHTNGTDALTVASDGVVTAPEYIKQTSVISFAVKNAPGSADHNTGQLSFDTEIFDNGSVWDTTNHRFEAPFAGVYHFSFSGFCCGSSGAPLASNNEANLLIQRSTDSGSTWTNLSRSYAYLAANAHIPMDTSVTVKLDDGDYVRVRMASGYIYSDSTLEYYFNGHLIG